MAADAAPRFECFARAASPALWGKAIGLRIEVFVHEQRIPEELEIDEKDDLATHCLLCDQDGEALAVARFFPDAADKTSVWIGRIAVKASHRRHKLATRIIQLVLEEAKRAGYARAVLHAQTYALGLYEKLGFVRVGEEFIEDTIPHFEMHRQIV